MGEAGTWCLLAGVGFFHPQPPASMKEGRVDQEAGLLGSQSKRPPGDLVNSRKQGKDSSPTLWFGAIRSFIHSCNLCPSPRQGPRVTWQSSWSKMDSFPALVILSGAKRKIICRSQWLTDIEDDNCCVCLAPTMCQELFWAGAPALRGMCCGGECDGLWNGKCWAAGPPVQTI